MSFCILIKIGQKEHIENLRAKGQVYMKPVSYFTNLENDAARSDRLDGSVHIIQPKHIGVMTISSIDTTITFSPDEIVGPVMIGSSQNDSCNVFCMYSITKPTDICPIDARILGFGDYFVMILNQMEFINRYISAANKMGLWGVAKPVKYFDSEEYSGDTGIFMKSDVFSYQREYRFMLKPGSKDAIMLTLGDLSDITSELMLTKDISSLLDFSSSKAKAAGLSW